MDGVGRVQARCEGKSDFLGTGILEDGRKMHVGGKFDGAGAAADASASPGAGRWRRPGGADIFRGSSL